jgi:hypothetical protein
MLNILQRSDHLLSEIRRGERKLVGWGTGSVFRTTFPRSALRLAYLVDNNPRLWGTQIAGLDVRPPEALREEEPSRLLVVIFSSFAREIERQLAELGPFTSVASGHLLFDETAAARIRTICATANAAQRPSAPLRSSRNAIVVQGPIHPEVTQTALRFYRATQPETALIVSTWTEQSAEHLAEIAPWCDRCVVQPFPAAAGRQNRNLQAVSTHAGLQAARELGAEVAFKTRSDCVLGRRSLADLAARALAMYSAEACHKHGLKGRIALASSYTRKWIPYHPSDLVMFGSVEDLIRYWSFAPDTTAPSADWTALSLLELSRQCVPSEVHAGRQFARIIGRPLSDTVADSWAFYRDHFLVLDDRWFGLLWAKNPGGAPGISDSPSSACIDHAFWQHLQFGMPVPANIEEVARLNSWNSDAVATSI